jgi:hypothetical protein
VLDGYATVLWPSHWYKSLEVKQQSRPDEGGGGVGVGGCGRGCVTVVGREMRCLGLQTGVGHGGCWAWRKWTEQR